jgi:ribosome-binding protein aMBF1 (putative translation factor)
VDDAIYALSCSGPVLGRPLVDTITAPKIKNLKELRPGSRSQGWEMEPLVHRYDPASRAALERKRHGLTQAQLAMAMSITAGRVSQIERGELATIEAVARYVEALGGRLDLIASLGDHTLTVTTTEAA